MTGSNRIVDHTTFAELQWKRDPFASTYFSLAPGFQRKSHLFDENFLEVLRDIHALQCVQDLPRYSCQNPVEMLRIDNQQASIGSRLVDLPKLSNTMEACYFAAYLSACMLCCKVWRHSVMPVSEKTKTIVKKGLQVRKHWFRMNSLMYLYDYYASFKNLTRTHFGMTIWIC